MKQNLHFKVICHAYTLSSLRSTVLKHEAKIRFHYNKWKKTVHLCKIFAYHVSLLKLCLAINEYRFKKGGKIYNNLFSFTFSLRTSTLKTKRLYESVCPEKIQMGTSTLSTYWVTKNLRVIQVWRIVLLKAAVQMLAKSRVM